MSFTKVAGSDYTLPANQDVLSGDVALTRGSKGMINAIYESGYTPSTSPEFTAWATDLTSGEEEISAENWSNLTFTNWLDAFGGQGSMGTGIANRPAVLYLTLNNIYLDIKFTQWDSFQGGGYTYLRAEPPSSGPTGDYNSDSFVDAADYTIWRNTLGSMDDLRANGDDTGLSAGVIDQADYAFWKSHFGDLVPGPGGASAMGAVVPEPALVASLSGGVALVLAGARLRRSRAIC